MMKRWGWIFFDVDEALLIFDSFTGLQRMSPDFSITFTTEDFQDYQAVNKSLWVDHQSGAVTSLQSQHVRFRSWAERLKIEPGQLNDAFVNVVARIYSPLPGAVSPLNATRNKTKIGIVTNGFTALQQIRLKRTGPRGYFDLLAISGQVGMTKPGPRIFNHTLKQADNPDRSHVLMAGNTAEFNILGDINARLSTCWLNMHHREQLADTQLTWTIASLSELEWLLCEH